MFQIGAPQMFAFSPFVDGDIPHYKANYRTQFSALAHPISPKIHILTIRPSADVDPVDSVLLRLEHFYQNNEENLGNFNTTSEPVQVDIQKLFAPFTVLSGEELNLAANKLMQQNIGTLMVHLQPMQIRTFRLQIEAKAAAQ
ncbi:hypothetical protein niasHT_002764 [Heterodera trifolii]|uniref:Glycosyl hydrolases family 38 C-terminal domain-containing protein n=1 Tax=Heterodera trifolii TaxID=157864 RepID=A0ABD2M838_9BILA